MVNNLCNFMGKSRIAVLILSLLMLVSCSDEPGDYGDWLMNIVTYEGTIGSSSQFSFQTRDDQPLQRLSATADYSQSLTAGQRCLVRYTILDKTIAPASVRVDYITAIPTGEITAASMEHIASQKATDMTVTSLWRSGKYLNVNGWVPYTGKPCKLLLFADSATVGTAQVEAWLVYDTMEETLYFDRRVYASYDISSVWGNADVRSMLIHVGDRTFTISK